MTATDTISSDHGDILRGTSCLVLGGGGFIGTHLCRGLTHRGARVHGFGRAPAYRDVLRGIRWTTAEFSDRAALARAIDGSDIIFHVLGGTTPESSNKDPVADLQGCTTAALEMLEICRISNVRKIVFVSSGGTVYGIAKTVPIPETASTEPICAYGISKLAVEKYLHLYRHLHGLDYMVLRIANPFGAYQAPDRRQGVIAAIVHRILQNEPVEIWGDGRVVRDFIYIEDVVSALIEVVGYCGPYRVFNVGSGVGRSILDVVAEIAMVLDKPRLVPIHKPGRVTDVPINILDISLIERETGWKPKTEWRRALAITASWLQSMSKSAL
ncbi:MAG: NAD-dependent epimerase/dehydratase family protein [Alphaproteobacteria bacterium]|nr:NAD-dependent epimerase/dehydratase family protein [Alphaproteobacteria bacterium]